MPNFLIVGAEKGGTTSLYAYLNQHPDIYMSPVKEPRYFSFAGQRPRYRGPGDDQFVNQSVTDVVQYASLFDGARHERRLGEASPSYLFTPHTPERIRQQLPGGRLLAILRQPTDRAYSAYLMRLRLGLEPAQTFEEAVAQETWRRQNGWFGGCYVHKGFYYAALSRYLQLFGRERFRIYLYDDLRHDARALVRDAFRFLEVDDRVEPDVSRRRNTAGRIVRHPLVEKLAKDDGPVDRLLPERVSSPLRWKLRRLNTRPKPPLTAETRANLNTMYRDDILRTQDLIGRDLSHWLQ